VAVRWDDAGEKLILVSRTSALDRSTWVGRQ
jgi:hypothetical protein